MTSETTRQEKFFRAKRSSIPLGQNRIFRNERRLATLGHDQIVRSKNNVGTLSEFKDSFHRNFAMTSRRCDLLHSPREHGHIKPGVIRRGADEQTAHRNDLGRIARHSHANV